MCSHNDANPNFWAGKTHKLHLPSKCTLGSACQQKFMAWDQAWKTRSSSGPVLLQTQQPGQEHHKLLQNPVCLPLPVCPAQKLPLRPNPPNIILSINLLSAPNVQTVAKENSFLCDFLSGAACERHTNLSCCCKDQMRDLSAEIPENTIFFLGKTLSLFT